MLSHVNNISALCRKACPLIAPKIREDAMPIILAVTLSKSFGSEIGADKEHNPRA
jgi:hypothetical protein